MDLKEAIVAFVFGLVFILITAPRKEKHWLVGWWHDQEDDVR